MKLTPRTPKLPALSCAAVLSLLLGAAACGSEADLPVIPNPGGGSGGTSVVPNGGSAGTVNGTAGTGAPSGGSGGAPSGGTGTGGSGTPQAGSGGTGTSGGQGGSPAGGTGGSGTSGSGTGGGGAGGGGNDSAIADALNGAMLLGPCLAGDDPLVCQTKIGQCDGDKPDFALSGTITTDKEITLGGDPAKVYTITLHVQGEVEAKYYENAAGDQEKSKASPMADGFQVGGSPTKGDAYNVYMLRVTSPKQDYFFNSLVPPGKSDHTTYGIDYTAKIQANGGTKIRLVAADRNCSMIKNCGPNNNGGTCNAPITIANIDAKAKEKNPSFKFGEPYNGQWVVMVVTGVTAN